MSPEHITKTIEDFLNKLTIDFDAVELVRTKNHNTFLIRTQNAGILIGNRGENLEALSYLIRRILDKNRDEEQEREVFIIDVNNYQTKKFQELIENAHLSAKRVKLFKQDVELAPMTSYERMIIHSAFSDDKEVITESDGQGKFRRVVIKYKLESSGEDSNPNESKEVLSDTSVL